MKYHIINTSKNIRYRNIIVVKINDYYQAFYQRTGLGGNSSTCDKGQWAPFFGLLGNIWMVKIINPELQIERYGTEELKKTAIWLDNQLLIIPEKKESTWQEINKWLFSFPIQGKHVITINESIIYDRISLSELAG